MIRDCSDRLSLALVFLLAVEYFMLFMCCRESPDVGMVCVGNGCWVALCTWFIVWACVPMELEICERETVETTPVLVCKGA